MGVRGVLLDEFMDLVSKTRSKFSFGGFKVFRQKNTKTERTIRGTPFYVLIRRNIFRRLGNTMEHLL